MKWTKLEKEIALLFQSTGNFLIYLFSCWNPNALLIEKNISIQSRPATISFSTWGIYQVTNRALKPSAAFGNLKELSILYLYLSLTITVFCLIQLYKAGRTEVQFCELVHHYRLHLSYLVVSRSWQIIPITNYGIKKCTPSTDILDLCSNKVPF